MRKLAIAVSAVLLLASAAPVFAAEPIRIGALAALTGGSAMSGQQAKEGLMMAEEDINARGGILGRPVKILIEDAQGLPTAGVNAFRKLVEQDHVPVVIGDHQSTVVLAFRPLAIQMGIPVLATGSAMAITENPSPWIFRVREYDALTARAMVNASVKAGAKKIAIFHNTDQFGVGGRDNIIAALKAKGLTPVAVEGHNTGDKDFTAQLLNIKKSGAEAMIVFSHNEEQALITRQVNQLIPDVTYYGSMVLGQASTIAMAQGAAEGKYTATPYAATNPDPQVQAFVKRHKAKYGKLPETFTVLYYDAAMMVAKAIEMGKSDKPAAIRDNLKKLKKFPGVSGLDYTFDEKGEAVNEIFILKIVNGQPQVVSKIEG
ncbi:MAG: ABC transporter substrate-binding protein [Chitinophagales bacterium]